MKVSNYSNLNNALGSVNSSTAKEAKAKPNAESSSLTSSTKAEVASAAKVNLSDDVQRMNKIKQIATEESADHAKIERLQKMIDAGEYKVDAAAVADRLVDEHLLMS